MDRPSDKWLECVVCGAQQELRPIFGGCPECARAGRKAPLEVRYDYSRAAGQIPGAGSPGIWRWSALLPAGDASIVSLHEGNTPLVKLTNESGTLLLKNETVNPTWSYKDRANSVSVSMARQFGFGNVAAISTGNHGNAAAAYAASAGMRCVVFCHEDAPDLQMALMQTYGATVFRGGNPDAVMRTIIERGDWFPCSTLCPRAGYSNPYGIEGFKTVAYEIVEQLGGRAPHRVYVPVGSGDGFYGIWKGFVELQRMGRLEQLPKMFACQAQGANPYVRAFREKKPRLETLASAHSIALSIAEPVGGEAALKAIYDSGGAAVEASDAVILKAARSIAQEGFALEPASAAAVACARAQSPEQGDEIWVSIGTGAAVKWPGALCEGFVRPQKLVPDWKAFL